MQNMLVEIDTKFVAVSFDTSRIKWKKVGYTNTILILLSKNKIFQAEQEKRIQQDLQD
jgi:hypothetical protein